MTLHVDSADPMFPLSGENAGSPLTYPPPPSSSHYLET